MFRLVIKNVQALHSYPRLDLAEALQLELLTFGGVFLVPFVFSLTHALRFLHAVPLALLVPAPLVDLSFAQASLLTQCEESVLSPVWL